MLRALVLAVLAFLGTAILIWVAAGAIYIAGSEFGWWRDRDGGIAMGFAFTIGPLFGVIGGLVAAVMVFVRVRRKMLQPQA